MDTLGTIRLLWTPRIRKRWPSRALLVYFPTDGCHLGYVMHLPHFRGACWPFFVDMVDKSIEVFMDDFSIFGPSFECCLKNLEMMLQRCVETNLILNWEKCHFMVREGIVLGHKISARGIKVDRAKIDIIEKLPPPSNFEGIRSFLWHAWFYMRFINDFSKIARLLSSLLNKDVVFKFDEECSVAF